MCAAARSARPEQRILLSLHAGDEVMRRFVNIRSQSVVFTFSGADDDILFVDIFITNVFGFFSKLFN